MAFRYAAMDVLFSINCNSKSTFCGVTLSCPVSIASLMNAAAPGISFLIFQ